MMTEVQGIAKRTNFLALNAAIEAARSGAQNGLHVIAKEVRKLSDTKQCMDKMNVLVKRLNERTIDVSSLVGEVKTQLEVARKESVKTREAFETIDAMMDEHLKAIQHVSAELYSLYDVVRAMNVAATQVAASLDVLHHTTQQW